MYRITIFRALIFAPSFVQQQESKLMVNNGLDLNDIILRHALANFTHKAEGDGACVLQQPSAVASWAARVHCTPKTRTLSLARHLHNAEFRKLAYRFARFILRKVLVELVEQLLAMRGIFHINEVNHDQTCKVAQHDLMDNLLCSYQVRLQ